MNIIEEALCRAMLQSVLMKSVPSLNPQAMKKKTNTEFFLLKKQCEGIGLNLPMVWELIFSCLL